MRKFLLALVAAISLASAAEAAPYKVQDANGVPFGPVIGLGWMIVTAPDGTRVGVFEGSAGFTENGTGDPQNHMAILYLQPDCSGPAYLDANRLPVQGYFFSSNGANSGTGQIDYPAQPYVLAGVFYTVVNGVCTLAYNSPAQPLLLGPGQIFNVSHPTPFSITPWVAPDTDPPTQ